MSAPSIIDINPDDPREALDQQGRPLCLMPGREILGQNLPHRLAALFLREPGGGILLHSPTGMDYSFFCMGIPPAKMGTEDFCALMLKGELDADRNFTLRPRGKLAPSPENPAAFTSIFSARASRAFLEDLARDMRGRLLVYKNELECLLDDEGYISPLLRLAFREGMLF